MKLYHYIAVRVEWIYLISTHMVCVHCTLYIANTLDNTILYWLVLLRGNNLWENIFCAIKHLPQSHSHTRIYCLHSALINSECWIFLLARKNLCCILFSNKTATTASTVPTLNELLFETLLNLMKISTWVFLQTI